MFYEFPSFQFGDYTLRAIDAAHDTEHFFNYITKKEVSDFIGEDSVPTSLEAAYRELSYWGGLFTNGRSYYWAIANKNNNIIGTVGFNNISMQHLRGEISYDLDMNYWQKGIMSNAIFRIIEFAFQKIGLVRIQATVGQHNFKSIKLLENLNFKKEGELAKYERLKGTHYDFYMYALTRDV